MSGFHGRQIIHWHGPHDDVAESGAFGIGRNQALAFSLVSQALGYVVITALGVPGLYGSIGGRKLRSLEDTSV